MRSKMVMMVLMLTMSQVAPSLVVADGVLRQRAAPPVPATTENGCMMEIVFGWPSDPHFRKNRAKDQAISRWEKEVKKKYEPQFAHWKHANRYTKEIRCQGAMRAQHRCYAKATPCRKPD